MSGIRDLSTLPLSPQVLDMLREGGFQHTSDLYNMRPFELSKELNVSIEIANNILEALSPACSLASSLSSSSSFSSCFSISSSSSSSLSAGPFTGNEVGAVIVSAKELAVKSRREKPIITFSKALDTLLGGGVPTGQITELCGLPGIGKTQLAIQLALDVQIPRTFSGLEGHTIYIDSEGSFMPERAATMANALSDHLRKLSIVKPQLNAGESERQLDERHKEKIAAAKACSRDYFLDGIHVFRVHDHSEQLATLNHLQAFVKTMNNVKLIIVDSIAFHFRQDLRDSHNRMRILGQVSSMLNELAYKNNLAVVVINHVTTSFQDRKGNVGKGGSSSITPALGEHWSHCITNRIMLTWEDKEHGVRKAMLVKSPVRACSVASFRITEEGIRDEKSNTKRSGGEHGGSGRGSKAARQV